MKPIILKRYHEYHLNGNLRIKYNSKYSINGQSIFLLANCYYKILTLQTPRAGKGYSYSPDGAYSHKQGTNLSGKNLTGSQVSSGACGRDGLPHRTTRPAANSKALKPPTYGNKFNH